MLKRDVTAVVATHFGIDRGGLRRDMPLSRLPTWDSARHIELICLIEETFGLDLDDREAARIVNVESIMRILEQRSSADESAPASRLPEIAELPIPGGSAVLLHSSVGALDLTGYTPYDLLESLVDRVVGHGGTLVMPSMTEQADLDSVARRSVSRATGLLPELLRRRPDAYRSDHPVSSFVAIGTDAERVVADQPLDRPEGPGGPLGRLFELDAQVLLLGVDFEVVTAVHLAEYLEQVPYIRRRPMGLSDGAADLPSSYVGLASCRRSRHSAVEALLRRTNRLVELPLPGGSATMFRLRDAVAAARHLLRRDPYVLFDCRPVCVECLRRFERGSEPRVVGVSS